MRTTRRAFLQTIGAGAAGIYLGTSCSHQSAPPPKALTSTGLPRATPESQGISSSAIIAFLDALAASKHEFHSFVLVRHGSVVAEGWWAPYAPQLNHTMYSMSKSFTSTAVGLAVSEGRLSVDDPVTKFFPGDLPAKVDENLAALRVKHLLSMSVGHAKDSTGAVTAEENWVRAFLAQPITHTPGSTFLYDSGATYMCSAIVTRLTGQPILEYLRPRLFEPLGIEGMTWQTCPRGVNTGGWGLSIRTEGLARFGQCYLQQGQYNGRQVVPAAWVAQATSKKIQQPLPTTAALTAASTRPNFRPPGRNDWLQGYCYQFWRSQNGAFRGDGAFGQYTIVMPQQDAVLAITSETSNMQGELDLVWEHLLPAMKGGTLPEDKPAASRLQQMLRSLAIMPPAEGTTNSPRATEVSGKTFALEPNGLGAKSVALTFEGNGSAMFHLTDEKGAAHAVTSGPQTWAFGQTAMPGTPPSLPLGRTVKVTPEEKVAASGAWVDADTYEMRWQYYQTPHHDLVTCKFDPDGKGLSVRFATSISRLGPGRKETRPVLNGKC